MSYIRGKLHSKKSARSTALKRMAFGTQNRYPVIPNALTLAKLLQEHGLTEKDYFTESEIESCLNSWIKSKLAYSTLNRHYSDTIAWLIAQIRSACKGVEILENNIKAIQNGDIA